MNRHTLILQFQSLFHIVLRTFLSPPLPGTSSSSSVLSIFSFLSLLYPSLPCLLSLTSSSSALIALTLPLSSSAPSSSTSSRDGSRWKSSHYTLRLWNHFLHKRLQQWQLFRQRKAQRDYDERALRREVAEAASPSRRRSSLGNTPTKLVFSSLGYYPLDLWELSGRCWSRHSHQGGCGLRSEKG